MNLTLLKFEFRKMAKRNKNKIVLILSFLLVIFSLIVNNWMNNSINTSKAEQVKFELESINEALLQLPPNDSKAERIKNDYLEQQVLLNEKVEAINSGDWKRELELQIMLDEAFIDDHQNGRLMGGDPLPVVKSRLAYNKELLRKNIEPAHDYYATQGYYFIKSIIRILSGMAGVILIVFLTGDILTNEFEKGNIKLLFSQPLSRITVLNAKFIVATLSSLILFLFINVFSFGLGSVFNGIGSSDYPVLIKNNGMSSFTDLSRYLMDVSIFFIFIVIFIVSLSIFLSVLTTGTLISTSLTIIITGLFILGVTTYGYFPAIAHLLPFTYINTFEVVNGELPAKLDNAEITYQNGILVLSLFSIIIYSLSCLLIKKKNIY